ncbi:MAG TPA: DMT family transporter [Dongiaceae bacterium]|jgi:drug/metabolite transporter (DMT)-like permease|nr:DMT family transporter [Dongiaceae bacterium]
MSTTPGQINPNRIAGLALLLLLSALWGSSYAFIKLGVATIPPITFIAARTVIASLLLLAILRLRGVRMPRDGLLWRRFAIQALLNSVVPFTLIAWGERSLDSGLATILNSTSPIFTFLLGSLLLRQESPTWPRLIGVIAGLSGVTLIVGFTALQGLGSETMAALAIVAATICYAGAALFGRQFRGLDPMLPAAGSLIAGSIILIPISLIVDRPWTLSPSAESLAALMALAVFCTALALVIYFRLLEMVGPLGTVAQAYLRVPIGVAIGLAFMGESLAPTAGIGLVLVIAGVFAMTRPARR